MTGDTAYAIVNADINRRHAEDTYNKSEINAKMETKYAKLEALADFFN